MKYWRIYSTVIRDEEVVKERMTVPWEPEGNDYQYVILRYDHDPWTESIIILIIVMPELLIYIRRGEVWSGMLFWWWYLKDTMIIVKWWRKEEITIEMVAWYEEDD